MGYIAYDYFFEGLVKDFARIGVQWGSEGPYNWKNEESVDQSYFEFLLDEQPFFVYTLVVFVYFYHFTIHKFEKCLKKAENRDKADRL